jgi:cytochrome b pre-mRNA-processing protein 3
VCSLPDTFMSWFVLTHLHVWLAMVRLQIPDSPDAQLVCKELYDVFWEDVEHRIRMTGVCCLV